MRNKPPERVGSLEPDDVQVRFSRDSRPDPKSVLMVGVALSGVENTTDHGEVGRIASPDMVKSGGVAVIGFPPTFIHKFTIEPTGWMRVKTGG